MSSRAPGPEPANGSWWTTLPGVLTGVAALVTALTGLLAALGETGLLSRVSPDKPAVERPVTAPGTARPQSSTAPSQPETAVAAAESGEHATAPAARRPPIVVLSSAVAARRDTAKIDGVEVTILGAQRRAESGAAAVDVQYKVATGQEFVRHDPSQFMKLVANGETIPPIWASGTATNLASNSEAQFAVGFPAATISTNAIVVRVGEHQHLDLSVDLSQ